MEQTKVRKIHKKNLESFKTIIRIYLNKISKKGLRFFFIPKWSLLLKPSIWANAAIQNFNSIGILKFKKFKYKCRV